MELENEIWKPVAGYEGIYEISSFGRLKTLSRRVNSWRGGRVINEKIRKVGKWANAYPTYILSKMNANKMYLAHRLVAEAFIPNPENKPEVNHVDGDKSNSKATNLEWCTSSENAQHSYNTGLSKAVSGGNHHCFGKLGASHPCHGKHKNERKGASHYKSKIVLNTQTGIFYDCIRDAADSIGQHYATLSRKLLNKRRNNTNFILV